MYVLECRKIPCMIGNLETQDWVVITIFNFTLHTRAQCCILTFDRAVSHGFLGQDARVDSQKDEPETRKRCEIIYAFTQERF